MPLSFSEELLSAYLDGEVTPEEKQYVQRLLEEQPELQDRLNEFAEVSSSIRELPREPAPGDFSSSILNQLPNQASAQSTQRHSIAQQTTAEQKSSRLQRWGSSLAAIAALLIVGTVLIYQRKPNQELIVDQTVDNGESAAEMAMFDEASENADAQPDDLLKNKENSGSLGLNLSTAGIVDPEGMQTLELSAAGAINGAATEMPANFPNTNFPNIVSLDRQTIRQHLSSLGESPAVGEELSILTSQKNAPILVDFTVVDVQKSLGTLQVLLKNHSVERLTFSDEVNVNANEKMVAIYLDLEEPDLENVLNQVAAIDATIFVEEQAWSEPLDGVSSAPTFLALDDSLPAPAARSKPGISAKSNAVPSSVPARPEPQARRAMSSATLEYSPEKSSIPSTVLTQNYHFDFDSVRSLNKKSQGLTSPRDSAHIVAESKPEAEIEKIVMMRPPSPSLPEKYKSQNSFPEPGKAGDAKQSMSKRPSVSNAPTQSGKPQMEEQKAVPAGRVRALLILREGNEAKNPR